MSGALTLLFGQMIQMFLVLLIAPAITGITRRTKARFMRRQGAPIIQPYRDLIKLMRKEVVVAENASWLFRSAPYAIFAATWVAAALVPTFATGLMFNWAADPIALVALLGSARFFLALAGMDVGTSFGGIGSSREMMIASLAEPAMLLDRVHDGADGGLDAASRGRQLHDIGTRQAARVAGACAGRADHRGDRRERAHPGRQSGDASRAHHGA